MAKSNRSNPVSNKQTLPPVPQTAVSARNWLERPAVTTDADTLLRKIFWGVAAAALVLMLAMSMGSGINADDKFQNDYSTKLVNYYSTMGKDSSALFVKEGNMHLYGGFFEIVSGFTNKIFGYTPNDLGYHNVRHAQSAFFGWLAMLCAGLLAMAIAGWRAGLITLVIMFLSPRFIGDALMNPKDIPFAAGYVMALYNMVRVLNAMPRPNRWHIAGLVGGLAIALATRAGGLLPFAIFGLFTGLHFIMTRNNAVSTGNIARYALISIGILISGYLLAILFWPFAMQSPLKNPLAAFSKFADLEVHIRVLFEGENRMSDKVPWNYPLKWIFYTIPLATMIGFAGSLVLFVRLIKRYNPLWIAVVFFGCIFPVFFIIYKHSVIHDGWRHLTFAYPTMAVAAGLFWNELLQIFSTKKGAQYAVYGALALSLADASWFIAANPKYPYTYFNPTIGGIKGAYGHFETDYWGVSVRQGIEWMEQQGILNPNMTETVIIATNMAYSAQKLTAKYGDKVRIKYLKWEKRCDDAWDYALYPTRFLDGTTLQQGMWPPDNAVHIVEASGVPLLAVLKDNGKNCSLGTAMVKVGDWQAAADQFKQEVANVPDNDLAWANLAQALFNLNQLDEAKVAAERALAISPDDTQANNLLGMYWMQKNDVKRATAQFTLAIKKEPNNPGAYYYLAIIAQKQGDGQTAMANLQKAIQIAPNFKPAYELAAQISEEMGNTSQAQQIRQMMQQVK